MRQFAQRDQALEAGRDGEYVLWFEADLYDQLQLTEILARLAGLGVPAGRVTLICIGEHAGIARFGGLGELTAEQLRELPHTNACARLTPAALELATRAWAAFRAPAPACSSTWTTEFALSMDAVIRAVRPPAPTLDTESRGPRVYIGSHMRQLTRVHRQPAAPDE
jgi:hypothetical protein